MYQSTSAPRGAERTPAHHDVHHDVHHNVHHNASLLIHALVLFQEIAHEALELLELTDERFMQLALGEARAAAALDEVPVGAILVLNGAVVARAHNLTHTRRDPTAHAELLCVSQAARELGLLRLCGATLYSTVEPCFMCAGALLQARVECVVWGVRDPKFGGVVSLGQVLSDPRANHRALIREGVCADEARALLQEFFRKKRGERA